MGLRVLLLINDEIVRKINIPAIIVASTCSKIASSIITNDIIGSRINKVTKKKKPNIKVIIKNFLRIETKTVIKNIKASVKNTLNSKNSFKTSPPNQSNPLVISLYLDSPQPSILLLFTLFEWKYVLLE
ncbi:hypothetical protein DSQ20_02125 [Nitrosarchaeum sp. AC2]|nr:hypothetical protein DSQ20_02125 [Nitrosarchaeum sp. AC2]